MNNDHPKLDASLKRLSWFKEEFKNCDSAARFQLLAAWKELIMDNFVKLLATTNDVDSLSNIDKAIALFQEIASLEL
jgi:hypothetical protein